MMHRLVFVFIVSCLSTGAVFAQVPGQGAMVPSAGVSSGGGSTSPGGTNGQVQYNNNGAFGGLTPNITTGCGATGGAIGNNLSGQISSANIGDFQTGTSYAIPATDCGGTVYATITSAATYTLPTLGAYQYVTVKNEPTSTANLTVSTGGSATIDANGTSVVLTPGQSVDLTFNSPNWTTTANGNASSGSIGSGTAGQIPYYAANGQALTAATLGGDCSLSGALLIVCTKTNGTSFAPSATTDTTNASNITSGVLGAAEGGAYSMAMVSGLYYATIPGVATTGSAQTQGYIFFVPVIFSQKVTLSAIGFDVTAAYSGSGTGYGVALYAAGTGQGSHTAVNQPDGAPLASSSFQTGTGTGIIVPSFSSNYSIVTPGLYFYAFQFGDASQKLDELNGPATFLGATAINLLGINQSTFGWSLSASGGSWPTLTSSSSLNRVTSAANIGFLAGLVASVP